MSFERGKIRNAKYAQILRDYSKLRWGAITPTDIDGFLDFGNKCFVFIESKHKSTTLTGGQKLALERLVDGSKIPSLLIVAEHDVAPGEEIEMSTCEVVQYRLNRKWHIPKTKILVKPAIDAFLVFTGYKKGEPCE